MWYYTFSIDQSIKSIDEKIPWQIFIKSTNQSISGVLKQVSNSLFYFFWQEYRKTGTQNKLDLLRTQGLAIISHYFSNQTQYEISMEDEILLKRGRRLLTQDIPSADAFQEMQDKIYSVIRDHYYTAFEQSDKYWKMLWELNLLRPMENGENQLAEQEQESKAVTPSRIAASVVSTMETRDVATRKNFTNYCVEVTAYHADGRGTAWTVYRRYMEFHDLHVQIEKKISEFDWIKFSR